MSNRILEGSLFFLIYKKSKVYLSKSNNTRVTFVEQINYKNYIIQLELLRSIIYDDTVGSVAERPTAALRVAGSNPTRNKYL